MPRADLVVYNIGELATFPAKPLSRVSEETAGIRRGAGIAVRGGRVVEVGSSEAIRGRYDAAEYVNAEGRFASPGLVDPHTHLVFAGSREDEFEMKLMGYSYSEILERGGGIYRTVEATRRASLGELAARARRVLKLMMDGGTTAVEVKSGYGLYPEDELKQLEAAALASSGLPVRIVATVLAHVVPREHMEDRGRYVELFKEIVREAAARGLATYVDVFCDRGAFTVEETREIVKAGLDAGLRARIHADQLSYIGCSKLAAELPLDSLDHLEKMPAENAEVLARAGSVAVLTPTSILAMREEAKPPVEALRRAGVPIAVASDYNPNNMTPLQQTAMDLSTHLLGLTPLEALAAATVNAAWSLRIEGGQVVEGAPADLVVWDFDNHKWVGYSWGYNKAVAVVVQGQLWRNEL
ncbi:MAG: imidazolonepropionase [Thermoproteota archaeon]